MAGHCWYGIYLPLPFFNTAKIEWWKSSMVYFIFKWLKTAENRLFMKHSILFLYQTRPLLRWNTQPFSTVECESLRLNLCLGEQREMASVKVLVFLLIAMFLFMEYNKGTSAFHFDDIDGRTKNGDKFNFT